MKGYRTLLFSLATAIVGVLSATDWVPLLGSQKAGVIVTAIGVVSAVLRFKTNTPVGEAK